MRPWAFLAMSVIAAGAVAQELPAPEDESAAFEIEPPILVLHRGADGSLISADPALSAPPAEIAKLEKDLARAERNAKGADGLYRAGILSKAEAEERALRVVRLEAALAQARLLAAKAEPEGAANVTDAEAAAARATAERHRAEVEAAMRNLERQRKLLALGSGRQADVHRAEEKLAELERAGE